MAPNPTGRRHSRADQSYLVVSRSFSSPIEEVWASITESDRTAAWFGPWTGDPASGTVQVQLNAEEGAPHEEVRILQCDAPRQLVLETGQDPDGWHMELDLIQREPTEVTLELSHRLSDPEMASQVGPGWEFYLDRLVAADSGNDPLEVQFDAYYPAQAQYYRELFL